MQGSVRAMGNYNKYPEPHDVAKAALRAFTSARPQPRYIVVPVDGPAAVTIRKAMDEPEQLNPGHNNREALVKMLDEALAKVAK